MDEEEKTAYFSELGLTEREVRMQVEGMSVTYLRISELCREAVSRYTECLGSSPESPAKCHGVNVIS